MKDSASQMNLADRVLGHLHTVVSHQSLVREHCFKCGLYRQGLLHDLSKFSPSELIPSIKYYQGYRSPYNYEKELKGYSLGWLHHKGHNLHHWEYWYDQINGEWVPVKMAYPCLIESICDRIAACKIYHKDKYTQADALNYFLNTKGRLFMHPETAEEMERILRMVAERGENETFRRIRQSLKEGKPL